MGERGLKLLREQDRYWRTNPALKRSLGLGGSISGLSPDVFSEVRIMDMNTAVQ